MSKLHPYAAEVLEGLRSRGPWEREFLQAVEETLGSISPVLDQNPEYRAEGILERLTEPDRIISFRVVWTDDANRVHVQRGYRVQFNNALGPYKGGTRFHSSVTLDSLKFLGFEQIFKNALTGLPLGGGKGGADFNFRGRSERERMRFCQGYMNQLHRHIGSHTDVPAGDIGVGTKEIGYLFGQFKHLTGLFSGTLTGKALGWGGLRLRPEATGYGVVYFAEEMLAERGESIRGKTATVSGFGNVAWGVTKKAVELGAKVVTLSGPDGFVHIPGGLTEEHADHMLQMRVSTRDEVKQFSERFGVDFHPGKRPWCVPCDIAFPCAIQNELEEHDAKMLCENGCRYVVEGANMPTTVSALAVLRQAGVAYAPGKAANAGGVAMSGMEMAQNRAMLPWETDHVDKVLRQIMRNIHTTCVNAARDYGHEGDYEVGANIGGFLRVAAALGDQGLV